MIDEVPDLGWEIPSVWIYSVDRQIGRGVVGQHCFQATRAKLVADQECRQERESLSVEK
jgi:hypothetical protein